jgi:hypothetical protein
MRYRRNGEIVFRYVDHEREALVELDQQFDQRILAKLIDQMFQVASCALAIVSPSVCG